VHCKQETHQETRYPNVTFFIYDNIYELTCSNDFKDKQRILKLMVEHCASYTIYRVMSYLRLLALSILTCSPNMSFLARLIYGQFQTFGNLVRKLTLTITNSIFCGHLFMAAYSLGIGLGANNRNSSPCLIRSIANGVDTGGLGGSMNLCPRAPGRGVSAEWSYKEI